MVHTCPAMIMMRIALDCHRADCKCDNHVGPLVTGKKLSVLSGALLPGTMRIITIDIHQRNIFLGRFPQACTKPGSSKRHAADVLTTAGPKGSVTRLMLVAWP